MVREVYGRRALGEWRAHGPQAFQALKHRRAFAHMPQTGFMPTSITRITTTSTHVFVHQGKRNLDVFSRADGKRLEPINRSHAERVLGFYINKARNELVAWVAVAWTQFRGADCMCAYAMPIAEIQGTRFAPRRRVFDAALGASGSIATVFIHGNAFVSRPTSVDPFRVWALDTYELLYTAPLGVRRCFVHAGAVVEISDTRGAIRVRVVDLASGEPVAEYTIAAPGGLDRVARVRFNTMFVAAASVTGPWRVLDVRTGETYDLDETGMGATAVMTVRRPAGVVLDDSSRIRVFDPQGRRIADLPVACSGSTRDFDRARPRYTLVPTGDAISVIDWNRARVHATVPCAVGERGGPTTAHFCHERGELFVGTSAGNIDIYSTV